jgi:NCAIR mutase (PurE)-related protein
MKSQLKDVLNKVHQGKLTPKEALSALKDYPYQDLGFAKIDHHRELRKGFPEIIYGLGKTDEQILKIAQEIIKKGSNLLITKVGQEVFESLKKKIPGASHNSLAKVIYLKQQKPIPGKGKIAVITAGTSDIPVAEEAAVTCDVLGNETDKIYDVGVAGLHRFFGEYQKIKKAKVIIVVAGMEGALPSVIAGIVNIPIIAVPTSVGYGASMKGLAALLAMLNSCPGGVGVVNIDNGFGAGYLASLINHLE